MAFRLGVTGTIGCGKTTVAAMIEAEAEAAWPPPAVLRIDADALAREAVAPGTPALAAINEAFGSGMLAADGTLDRSALAARVFADRRALERLNAIVHPPVRRAEEELMARYGDRPLVVLDVPLLIEAGMRDMIDRLLVVTVSERARFARLKGRGMNERQIIARLGMQWPQARKAALADDRIDNSGPLAETRRRVRELMERWSREGRIPPFPDPNPPPE
jgi:dephospho-CoA kinase